MAVYSDFISNIVTLLRENGLPADIEYPHKPICSDGENAFCLVGLRSICADHLFPCDGGAAAPVELQVLFRLHCDPKHGIAFLTNILEQTILPTLTDHFYDLRSVQIADATFDKNIGRLVLNAVCTIHGTLARILDDDEGGDGLGSRKQP